MERIGAKYLNCRGDELNCHFNEKLLFTCVTNIYCPVVSFIYCKGEML